jgi:adenine-specific DNA-methyltransferase
MIEDIQRLRDIFPQAFEEEKIDFEKLRSSLGKVVDAGTERFTFSWAGRRNSIL